MSSDAPREIRQNTVLAAFDDQEAADAAVERLHALGIREIRSRHQDGRIFLNLNAGPREQEARLLLMNLGAELRDQPG